MESFVGLNAQVLGISVDHVPCLQAWAESLGGISYPLLSDFWPHGSVASQYGVLRSGEGTSERAIFVIDKDGIIRYIDIHAIDDRPDNEELRKVLRQLQEKTAAAEKAVEMAQTSGVYFGEPDEEAVPPGDVILYCARWCKDCRKARAWLEDNGLRYVEVDIDQNMAARKQVRQWAGGFLVTPVIRFYGEIILDYNVEKLDAALARRYGIDD